MNGLAGAHMGQGLPYLMGSDRKHRPQASLTFCQKDSAAMALLKVTGMGRSPRWNLQKGTLLAWSRGHVGHSPAAPAGPSWGKVLATPSCAQRLPP